MSEKITDIVTLCPNCGEVHVDFGEWYDRPHRTHLCLNCGETWQPSEEHTRGVDAFYYDGETVERIPHWQNSTGATTWIVSRSSRGWEAVLIDVTADHDHSDFAAAQMGITRRHMRRFSALMRMEAAVAAGKTCIGPGEALEVCA